MFINVILRQLPDHGAQFQTLVIYEKEQTVKGEVDQMSEHQEIKIYMGMGCKAAHILNPCIRE